MSKKPSADFTWRMVHMVKYLVMLNIGEYKIVLNCYANNFTEVCCITHDYQRLCCDVADYKVAFKNKTSLCRWKRANPSCSIPATIRCLIFGNHFALNTD